MANHIPAREYFEKNYATDFEVFGGDMMCGASLSESLQLPKRARFFGLREFVICQFELNLLNQAIYTHSCAAFAAWRRFSAPFADTRLCFSGHGMGSHAPHSILRFAQQPMPFQNAEPVSLNWNLIHDYTAFFLRDYIAQFIASQAGMDFSRETFIESIKRDQDCFACVLTPAGWETKHVTELLTERGATA